MVTCRSRCSSGSTLAKATTCRESEDRLPVCLGRQASCLSISIQETPAEKAWRLSQASCLTFESICDFEAHLAGGAGDDAEGGFVVVRVEVFAFGVHDIHDLFARDLAHLCFVWLFCTGGDVGRFFQE